MHYKTLQFINTELKEIEQQKQQIDYQMFTCDKLGFEHEHKAYSSTKFFI